MGTKGTWRRKGISISDDDWEKMLPKTNSFQQWCFVCQKTQPIEQTLIGLKKITNCSVCNTTLMTELTKETINKGVWNEV